MKIFNIMLSRELGGIQQSFLDYTQALKLCDHSVFEITSIASKINSKLNKQNIKLVNMGAWDPISPIQLRKAMRTHLPDAIIAHGNRAIKFALKARGVGAIDIPIIGVAHNYNIKWLKKCDYILSITKHLKNYLSAHGALKKKIFIMPNLIHSEGHVYTPNIPSDPIVIGVKARLVKKKGIEIFLQSLARLKRNGISFKALIAGDGPELNSLKRHVIQMGLKTHVEFLGWVHDKESFFNKIDILCVPSLHEPFGIIVLEGMLHSKAIICTESEGPSEILTNEVDSLMCPIGSNKALSDKLMVLINDQELRNNLSQNAFNNVVKKYDTKVGAKILNKALPLMIKDYK